LKSLANIQSEFLEQRAKKDSELLVEVREAAAEKDALLQRAGITDRLPDALKHEDEATYRRRIREMVFKESDPELRRQIMSKIDTYRYKLYDRWEMRSLFEEKFANSLRTERCRLPRLLPAAPSIAVPLVSLGIVYWFSGALDALVVGIGLLLPALVFFATSFIADLHLHDVTMQEAIKFVDESANRSKHEATRLLHLPEIFSSREMSTGQADAE